MRLADPEKARGVIGGLDFIDRCEINGDALTVHINNSLVSKLLMEFAQNGLEYTDFEQSLNDIEDEYNNLCMEVN